MNFVEEIARETLVNAHRDLGKGRRALLLVAGLMALIHLLTVHPYLRIAGETAVLETSIERKSTVLAALEPELARLASLQALTRERLDGALSRATSTMVADFSRLGDDLRAARDGDLSPDGEVVFSAPPHGAGQVLAPAQQPGQELVPQQQAGPPEPFQQMAMPEQLAMPQQMPLGAGNQGPSNGGRPARIYIDPPLAEIIIALDKRVPDARERMSAYARRSIVEPAYERAQRAWAQNIRSPYLDALQSAAEAARSAAAALPESADALSAAADALVREKEGIAALVITPDPRIDESFAGDWWATVGGKVAFADAIVRAVAEQLQGRSLLGKPFSAVEAALKQQEAVQASLLSQRAALEQQFTEQRKQLAALAGASAVVPVDLRSFIGLFPLVLGLVLGLMLIRIAQARREAALALKDLAEAAPEAARETRLWLGRRALGGHSAAATPSLQTAVIGGLLVVWVVGSALAVMTSPLQPPLPAPLSAGLGMAIILGACAWDIGAIRLLVAGLAND